MDYAFKYDYNPDYTDIHRGKMWSELIYPNKRESGKRESGHNSNYTDILPEREPGWMDVSENELWAYVTWPYSVEYPEMVSNGQPRFSFEGIPVQKRVDEMGYYFDEGHPQKGRTAWSLTAIEYPTGGKMIVSQERDRFNYSDRNSWTLKDDELTNVQTAYNGWVSEFQNYQNALCISEVSCQDGFATVVREWQAESPDFGCKFTPGEFHYPMNEYSGDLRVKTLTIDDGLGTQYIQNYTYGTGNSDKGKLHGTNSSYWNSFMSAFQKHLKIQRAKDEKDQFALSDIDNIGGSFRSFNQHVDFFDAKFVSSVKMDLRYEPEVIYPAIKTTYQDGSASVKYFSMFPKIPLNQSVRPYRNVGNEQKDVFVITSNQTFGLGLLEEEAFYKANSTTPYHTKEFSYFKYDLYTRNLNFRQITTGTAQQSDYTNSHWVPVYGWFETNYSNNRGYTILNGGSGASAFLEGLLSILTFNQAGPCYSTFNSGQFPSNRLVTNLYSPLPAQVYKRHVSRVIRTAEKTSTYEGLQTTTTYSYRTNGWVVNFEQMENSDAQSGTKRKLITRYRYPSDVYIQSSDEYQELESRNWIHQPVETRVHASEVINFSFSENNVISSSAQQFVKRKVGLDINGNDRWQIFPLANWSYLSPEVDEQEGWIQNFHYFRHYNFMSNSWSGVNNDEWIPSGEIIADVNQYGVATALDNNFYASRQVFGYQGKHVKAFFQNTQGLDASYLGFEDYTEDYDQINGFSIYGDNWGLNPVQGGYDQWGLNRHPDAHTGEYSFKLINGNSFSPERIIDLTPRTFYTQHRPTGNQVQYRVVVWLKPTSANVATQAQIRFDWPNSSSASVTYPLNIPAQTSLEWKEYEVLLNIPLNQGNPTFKIVRSDGNPTNLLIDDIIVGPESAEYKAIAYNYQGRPTATIGFNNQISKADYDSHGRLSHTFNAKNELVSEYKYQITADLANKSSYIEVASYANFNQVGISRIYLDGLGRKKMNILWEPGEGRALITDAVDYNVMGRPYRYYQPIPLPNFSGFPAKAITDYNVRARQFYQTNHPFTQTNYENSPEGRVVSMLLPRRNWMAPDIISFDFGTNTSVVAGFAAGQLLKRTETKQDGQVFIQYLDKLGNLVYKIDPLDKGYTQQSDGGVIFGNGILKTAETKFIYDQANRLIEVINPEGQLLKYTYNSIGDMTKEDHPDKGVTLYAYNRWGQLRFVIDEENANVNFVLAGTSCTKNCGSMKYFKYDALGRTIEEGVVAQAQTMFDNASALNDPKFPFTSWFIKPHVQNLYSSPNKLGRGRLVRQTVKSEFVWNPTLTRFEAGKSDMYSFIYNEDGLNTQRFFSIAGLSGSYSQEMDYDRQGRMIGKAYDKPTSLERWIKYIGYDDFGRLRSHYSGTFNTGTQTLNLQEDIRYQYDDAGRLNKKYIGSTGSINQFQEEVDIRYDIQNRISEVTSSRFKYNLTYDRRGRVSVQRWQNDPIVDIDPDFWHMYTYQYDFSNRLVAADYSELTYMDGGGGASSQRLAGGFLSAEVSKQNSAEIYASAKDNFGRMAIPSVSQYASIAPVDVKRYGDESESEYAIGELLGEENLRNFNPVEELNQVIFLESVLQKDGDAEKSIALDLSATGLDENSTVAVVTPSTKYDVWYYHDRIGNHSRIKRKLWFGQIGQVQDFTYAYTSGKINSHLLNVNGGYNSNYAYDLNGNLKADSEKDIVDVEYDWRNLPVFIDRGNTKVRYRYTGGGQRMSKQVYNGTTLVSQEFYLDDEIVNESGLILRIDMPDGYLSEEVNNGSVLRNYILSDWLGSRRVVFSGAGQTTHASDYYPYGMELGARSFTAGSEGDRNKFTGHERDAELAGIDYHGARYYNSVIGRYLSVDPLRAEMASWNSYHYTLDNPINLIDPDGRRPVMGGGNEKQIYAHKGSQIQNLSMKEIYEGLNGAFYEHSFDNLKFNLDPENFYNERSQFTINRNKSLGTLQEGIESLFASYTSSGGEINKGLFKVLTGELHGLYGLDLASINFSVELGDPVITLKKYTGIDDVDMMSTEEFIRTSGRESGIDGIEIKGVNLGVKDIKTSSYTTDNLISRGEKRRMYIYEADIKIDVRITDDYGNTMEFSLEQEDLIYRTPISPKKE